MKHEISGLKRDIAQDTKEIEKIKHHEKEHKEITHKAKKHKKPHKKDK